MRTAIFKTLAAALLMVLALPPTAAGESITHIAAYDYSKLTIGSDTLAGVAYATVNYEGLYNGGAPGAPSLPVDYIRFSVPYNATGFTVSAKQSNNTISSLNHMVYPCQEARLMSDTTAWSPTLPDSAIYYGGAYYPAQTAWVVDEGYLAGENHIVTVAVMPVSYRYKKTGNVTLNSLKESSTVKLTLSYEQSDTPAANVLVRGDSLLRNEGFELTGSMVVNPAAVRGNAVPATSPLMHYHGVPAQGQGDDMAESATYLIVTTNDMAHAARRVAALKRQKGYSVKVVTMDEVLASPYSGDGDLVPDGNGGYHIAYSDDAGKLREYLRHCFCDYGTKYVFLVGTDVPYRYANDLKCTYKPGIFDAPSDLYYSDLTGDWSAFAIDTDCELYVGRLLCKEETQIDNYSDKLLRYELNPGKGDYSYLNRAFYSVGRGFDVSTEWNPIMSRLGQYFTDPSFIYDDKESYPTGKDIIDSLRVNHCGLFIPFNHGDTTRIMVFGDTDHDNTYNRFVHSWRDESKGDGLNNMKNKDYPMVLYSVGCSTVPYDNKNGINVGESFTTGKDYGGPVYIGYTREAVELRVYYLLRDMIKELPAAKYRMAVANAFSKEAYCAPYPSAYPIKEYINEPIINAYLGDPELEMWTDIPQTYTSIGINRSDNAISVNGIDGNSTIVAYYSNDGKVGTETISTSSVTLNGISPNSTIMLYKHNHIPYIAPLSLQNTTLNHSQYVIASDVTAGNSIDDNRTSGDVTVPDGVEYEIEASGKVTLEDGFKVEKGATFAIYPSCF